MTYDFAYGMILAFLSVCVGGLIVFLVMLYWHRPPRDDVWRRDKAPDFVPPEWSDDEMPTWGGRMAP